MRAKVILAVLIFLLVFLGLGLAASPPILMGATNTSSEFGSVMGIQGTSGHPVWAAEILEHRYVTSGNLNGDSQEISANVGLVWNPTEDVEIRITDAYYIWTISSAYGKMPGYGLQSTERTYPVATNFPRELLPGQEFLMGMDKWNIRGPVIGTLEFSAFARYEVCLSPGEFLSCEWSEPQLHKFASDTALLVSGAGSVKIVTPQPVDVGSAIAINYATGVATDAKGVGGWLLQVLAPTDMGGGGGVVASWTHEEIGNLASGTVLLTVASKMINTGSDNRYQVRLYNSLLQEQEIAIVVLGSARNAPQAPLVSYTINQVVNGVPTIGGIVTLSFTSVPAENPIVVYDVVISGITEIEQPGNEYVFRLGEKSNLKITVTAFDGEYTSAPTTVSINFGPPSCGNCLGIPSPLAASGLLFYAFFAVLVALASALIWILVPLPWVIRALLVIAVTGVTVFAMYWAVVPVV